MITRSICRPAPRGRAVLATLTTALAACVLASPRSALGQVVFGDVSAPRGIVAYPQAAGELGGIAAADFDRDGDIDFFVPTGIGQPNQLYRNLGDGSFEEIAALVGLDATIGQDRVAVWFDYDGDHDLDLAVGGDCKGLDPGTCPGRPVIRLYRQEIDGTFTDVSVAAGLNVNWTLNTTFWYRPCITAGDIDNDGWLDLYVTEWHGALGGGDIELYKNNGDGTFTDVSVASGVGSTLGLHHQAVFHDFDGDGDQDIYAAIDAGANLLWENQGDGTFANIAAMADADNGMNDMGVTLGDYDNDGDLDIYITNIYREAFNLNNVLLRNDTVGGVVSFTDVSAAAGVENGWWGWGTTFMDCNNDGLLDIAATNGLTDPTCPQCATDPSKFFLNNGDGTFADVSDSVGFNDTLIGSGLVAFDADRDGDLELVQATSAGQMRLLDNARGAGALANNWIVVKPRMAGTNHWAIGAVVRVTAGGTEYMRPILAGTSLGSQEPAEAFIGVGAATTASQVRVEWPDGRVTTLGNIPTNIELTITDCPGDFDENGAVGFGDLSQMLNNWGPCAAPCPYDIDGNGAVGFNDLNTILSNWGSCS